MLKNKSRSKESRVRAIESNKYVNGTTDTDAGADCRFIIRFMIFFFIIFVEVICYAELTGSIHKVLNYRNKVRCLLVTVYYIFSLFNSIKTTVCKFNC